MAAAHKVTARQIAQILRRYQRGEGCQSIGRRFDISGKSVEYHLKRAGVYQANRNGAEWEAKREEMVAMYATNVPMEEMVARFGTSAWNLSRRLKRWGVRLRPTERTKIVNRHNVTEIDIVAKYRETESVGKTAVYFDTSDVTIGKILKRQKVKGWRDEFREFMEANKAFILERYRDGFGLISVARELNISYSSLYLNMRRWGIARAYPGVKDIKERLEAGKDAIFDAHFNRKITMGELAETYDVSRSRIGLQFKAWGWTPIARGINTSIERAVEKMLKTMGVTHQKQFPLDRKRYDFYLPLVNTIIETHGDYWHGNPRLYAKLDGIQQINRKRDRVKRALAKAHGHRLITLWECDINEYPERIEKRLRELLPRA